MSVFFSYYNHLSPSPMYHLQQSINFQSIPYSRDAKSCVSRPTSSLLQVWQMLLSQRIPCLWDAKFCVSTWLLQLSRSGNAMFFISHHLTVETQNLASPVQHHAFYMCAKCFFRSTFIACETQDFASLLGYRNHSTPPSPRIRIPPMPFSTAQTPFNPYRINLYNTIKSEIKTNIQYFSTIRHVPTLAFTDKKR